MNTVAEALLPQVPERCDWLIRLYRAILEDAIGERDELWVRTPRHDAVGFDTICRALGFDVAAARAAILRRFRSVPKRPIQGSGPVEARFWSLVDRTGDCWTWQKGDLYHPRRATSMAFWDGFHMVSARKFAWKLAHGTEPATPLVARCRNLGCVRPDHVEERRKVS